MSSITHNGITLEPETGIGVQDLTVSAGTYTGREDRSAIFSASGTGSYSDVKGRNSLAVIQKGLEFIDFSPVEVGADESSATINGSANVAILKISGSTGSIWDYLSSAEVNDVTVTKTQLSEGYTVPNDPGKSEAYTVTFYFENLPANTGASTVLYSGAVTGGNGTPSKNVVINKLPSGAQDVSIWFSNGQSSDPTTATITINLDADGNISGGSTPYINTIPTDVSWTINTENS